ncbi:MAG: choice-of-anchor K domain-containing protein [Verrucomicrobiota bacterium]
MFCVPPAPSLSRRAFSLIELLLVLSLVAIFATVGIIAVTGIFSTAGDRKLESDVTTLNTAIRLYVSNGGDLDGLATPEEILRKLKTSLSRDDRERHVGAPSGKMVDPRLVAVSVDPASSELRAVYNSAIQRFEIASSGNGFTFSHDESAIPTFTELETRDPGAVLYAENSGWVWDNSGTSNPSAANGPSSPRTRPAPGDTNPAAIPTTPTKPKPPVTPPGTGDDGDGTGSKPPKPVDPEPKDPPIPTLPKPRFSKPAGDYPESEFPLEVAITNVPDAATAEAVYQIDNGPIQPYLGPVAVNYNETLRAQFLTRDTKAYKDSPKHSAHYYPVAESFSGEVNGRFHSPTGGPNLKYSFSNSDRLFTHGDPVFLLDGEPVESGDPNLLGFTPRSFSNVAPGETFKIGTMTYRNGNSYYDSHASGVKLVIQIAMPNRGETVDITLDLSFVNTENTPDDPQASADFVKINNLSQDIGLVINEVPYRMRLTFGATDSFGFSNASRFHVYEGATAEGDILATFFPKR